MEVVTASEFSEVAGKVVNVVKELDLSPEVQGKIALSLVATACVIGVVYVCAVYGMRLKLSWGSFSADIQPA